MARSSDKLRSFRNLPAFKLERLAALVERHHELRHQRRFGLRSVECRVIGVVGAQQPVSLRRVCEELDLDKGHGSRLVSRLVQAGLLERRDDPEDQRSFYLMLTADGADAHRHIHADAVERNAEWMAGLPADRQADFLECLALLTEHSAQLLDYEMAQAHGPRAAPPPVRRPGGDGAPASLLLVERARLEALHEQLGHLLDKAGGGTP